ncbi:MAG: hypothetical protein KF689_01290 [Gemmatimonadaceae bacterium]|nr:hypothetical protein [Gemmatimonadaceae bacterium]MCW5826564.1 hypothetical protein [Gemmatimonadaceae bacterium]
MLPLAAVAALALAAPLGAQQAPPTETAVPASAGTVRGTGPNGATLRCRDGFYPSPGAADAACATRGGVLVRFPTTHNADRRGVAIEQPGAVSERRGIVAPEAQSDSAKPAATQVPWAEQQARARAEAQQPVVPIGARLLCGDGTYVVADTSSVRCAGRGGVRLRLTDESRVQLRPIGTP